MNSARRILPKIPCPCEGCAAKMDAGRLMCSGHWLRVSMNTVMMLRRYDRSISRASGDDLDHLREQRAAYWREALSEARSPSHFNVFIGGQSVSYHSQ